MSSPWTGKAKPEGAALEEYSVLIESIALNPDPLPDLRHIPSFVNAPNLAVLGYQQDIQTAPVNEEQEHDEREHKDAELEQGSEGSASATPVPTQPKTNKRKRSAEPSAAAPAQARPDRSLLADKNVPVEVFLFDESISNTKSVSPPPWHHIGTTDVALSLVKRPKDFVELTIAGIGGQNAVGGHLAREEGPNEEQAGKIVGNAVIWMAFQEYGRRLTEGWHFCGPDLLRAFLEKWIAQEDEEGVGGLEVRVLLWRHDEARKARTARRFRILLKPEDGIAAV